MASLAGLLERSARLYDGRRALVCGAGTTTYAELWLDVRRAAGWMSGRIAAGDRVLVQLPNGREFVVAYYAVLAAGGVVVPLHARATDLEREAVARDSDASLVLAAGGLGYGAEVTDPVARADDDPAAILYTSGTSGDPKGVVLTHGNLLSNATVASRDVARFTADDVMLVTVQFAHAFGMTSVLNACLYAGASLVVPGRWDAGAALGLMRAHGVTVVRGVPTTYVDLLGALPAGAAGPPLRAAFSGGASMPVALLERVEAAFATTVWEGYGLTEASPLVACNQVEHGRRPGTVGQPVPGVEVRIDESTGELLVRGPNVMAGYWHRQADTAAVLVDGWLRTGDIATIDADGFVRILDRSKDVIKRGGAAVYPREVEERLAAHPAVRAAAVVGVPDERLGERVVAVVVPGAEVSADELHAWCRDALTSYKCPAVIEFVDRLPLGPSGKVLKRELRASLSAHDPTGAPGVRDAALRPSGPRGD
ncbi:MAG: long-chain fatty acid--CoA ligase [Frankiales bacterium]|nr:long-chain fatty acid--CoA ligase [Frankiales bacterium]